MARIEDLIDEIPDPKLREQLAHEVKQLKSTKRFGLVYEEHVPETVSLFGLPIREGAVVQKRTEPDDPARFVVRSVAGEIATIVPVGADEPTSEAATRDLLTVKRFEEPIFPGLTPVGEVRRGPADKPAHTVINAENFHALQLLAYTHAGKVDVIYIDPPYNTGARDWKYNNRFVDGNDSYRHSKWLAMMEKRLRLAKALLKPEGLLIVTIDENELHHLGVLLEDLFPASRVQAVTIVINPSGASGEGLSRVEEYALYVAPTGWRPVTGADDLLNDPGGLQPQVWESLLRRGSAWYRTTRKNLCYPVLINPDTMLIEGVGPPHPDVEDDTAPDRIGGSLAAWPIRSDGRLGIWRVEGSRLVTLANSGYAYVSSEDPVRHTWTIKYLMTGVIKAIESGTVQIGGRGNRGEVVVERDDRASRVARTVWHRGSHTAGGSGGTQLLTALLGERGRFDFPKSVYAVYDALRVACSGDRAVVLDFFAGSGTTLNAVAMMNAEDDGRRQCILVTNNDVSETEAITLAKTGRQPGDTEYEAQGIFEAVTKPRAVAAITGTRPDGKPVEGKYLEWYLPDHSYADGFEENVAFFRMDYLEPDFVDLGRQYQAIAPLLWMAAGSVGSWERWDGKTPWSSPSDSTYAVLFDESQAPAFGAHVESRPEITHAWIVTDSHSAFVELQEQLPEGVVAGQLYRDYLRNFVINVPGALK